MRVEQVVVVSTVVVVVVAVAVVAVDEPVVHELSLVRWVYRSRLKIVVSCLHEVHGDPPGYYAVDYGSISRLKPVPV